MRGNVTKRGAKWYAVYDLPRTPDGKRQKRWEAAGKTKKSAEDLLTQRLSEIQKGGYVMPSKVTVAQYLNDWLETEAKPRLRPASFKDYESCIRLHLNPILGSMALQKLTPMHVKKAYTALAKEGGKEKKGLSDHRIHRIHRVLSSALKNAVELDSNLVNRNVAASVHPAPPKHPEMVTLTPEQARGVLEAVESMAIGPAVALTLYCGLRRSETCGLKWADVHLDDGYLRVERTLQRVTGQGLVPMRTKTNRSRRKMPLGPESIAMLRKHRARQAEQRLSVGPLWSDGGWLFTDALGRPLSPDVLSHEYATVAGSLGLPTGLHSLRHTMASLLLLQNTHPSVVAERLGHSNPTITLSIYSHVLPELGERAAVAFEEALRSTPRARLAGEPG